MKLQKEVHLVCKALSAVYNAKGKEYADAGINLWPIGLLAQGLLSRLNECPAVIIQELEAEIERLRNETA